VSRFFVHIRVAAIVEAYPRDLVMSFGLLGTVVEPPQRRSKRQPRAIFVNRPKAIVANTYRESPQLPKVTPGLAGVASFSTLKAKVNPARISFTARPFSSA
jgi:hypothetical protein